MSVNKPKIESREDKGVKDSQDGVLLTTFIWNRRKGYELETGLAGLRNPTYLEKVKVALVEERERLYMLLKQVSFLNLYPSHSNFILCEVTVGRDAKNLKIVASESIQDTGAVTKEGPRVLFNALAVFALREINLSKVTFSTTTLYLSR
ncbi:unnamed protein product [Lactuca saligna]|uniref:Uncharacterized protein n=1 Tax=Lactuca saligna TaxID=75948 RepID=A0AA35VIL4_LACSI|nr:unnamed protein product [Lactuca saligna]